MANPTYILFGDSPTTIILNGSGQLDGGVMGAAVVPTIADGLAEFPAQASAVGRLSHDTLVKILEIVYAGGGTLTVTKNRKSDDSVLATISSLTTPFYLNTHEYLKCVTVGATNPKVTVTGNAIAPGRGV